MFKVGMYVRCPIDINNELDSIFETHQVVVNGDPRTYYLGQIVSVDKTSQKSNVVFHDPFQLRSFFVDLPEAKTYSTKLLSRTSALQDSIVNFKGKKVRLISISKKPDKEITYYNYYVEYFKDGKAYVGEVSETQIQIPFTRANYNPINQMIKYELQNPMWYLNRRIVSKSLNILNNSPYGFKNLLGTRVHLFSHQVDTIVRALSEEPCRLMLADEVGLGKTIEALAIIKGMLDKRPKMRSLIVVPETLIYQWQTELSFKFWFDAPIFGVDPIGESQIVLVSTSSIVEDCGKILKGYKWDMCVVDETHKLLNNNDLYNTILNICKFTENILLLSATPILHREQEYHMLLTLLNPKRFEKMPVDEFDILLNHQKNITDIVFNLMRDLPDYDLYNLSYDFIDGLTQINEEINDEKLAELISQINHTSEDKGLAIVKLALSYIAEFYQIERGIIRHRRAEIENTNIKRELIEIPYEMAGADVGFYEENSYNALVDYIETFYLDNLSQKEIEFKIKLISAVCSSPYALLQLIKDNKSLIKGDISTIITVTKKWKSAVESEILRIGDVSDNIESFYSKFSKIVDYVDQEDVDENKKFLIFTAFTETAKKLEECFNIFFGKNSTQTFHSNQSGEEMQAAASQFQNEKECRFMICDESGGEGRNFQVADYIVHCDLPWSPAMLEQRIGRLDRIGRDVNKNVISCVVHSQDSLENDLFNIYNEGLNIFNQSLCGMEIAFGQINNTIENALNRDVRFGLGNIITEIAEFAQQMNEEVERERYFDLARQLDFDLKYKLEKQIAYFTENDGQELMNTMLAWPEMAGFRGVSVNDAFKDGSEIVSIDTVDLSLGSMENSLYFPPNMSDIVRKSKYKNDIRGTFSRNAAVKHENITFFAPHNPFFDSITKNAEECYKGRSVAFKYIHSDIKWKGILQTWHIKYDPSMLYQKRYSSEIVSLISRYLPSEEIRYACGINSTFNDITTEDIIQQLEHFQNKKPIHLGKRDDGMIDDFKKRFPNGNWFKYIKDSYKLGKKYALKQAKIFVESEKAKKDLQDILIANRAREIYYGYHDEHALLINESVIEALIYGLEHPIIELDSVAFIIFE